MVLDGQVLGKPHNEAHALEMLTALAGREHHVYTGVAVLQDSRELAQVEDTAVWFRDASEAELNRYIATGEPMDKAGAYGIQGRGGLLVSRIEGTTPTWWVCPSCAWPVCWLSSASPSCKPPPHLGYDSRLERVVF